MCGIAGIFNLNNGYQSELVMKNMLLALKHRGPDGNGVVSFTFPNASLFLGHTRLSIIDLSSDASQPMLSKCRRYSIVFNGEVYNYIELRNELRKSYGIQFETESDTEVVLVALIYWGVNAFKKFNGMWAIAFYDSLTRKLLLSRDRFGIKPLYTYSDNGNFLFGSEIKAILKGARNKFDINYKTLYKYIHYKSLDTSDETFFDQIAQFPKGHYQICNIYDSKMTFSQPVEYWKLSDPSLPYDLPIHEFQYQLNDLLRDSVSLRMRSDVPVGLLLSGGVDSSCIASIMMESKSRIEPLAISMVSDVSEFSEEFHIDIATTKIPIPTKKIRLKSDPIDFFDKLNLVTYFNDEPVGSFSNIAQYYLMHLARSAGVKVILSGQGADEILCGYRKYVAFYVQYMLRRKDIKGIFSFVYPFIKNKTVISQFNLGDARRYIPKLYFFDINKHYGEKIREQSFSIDLGIGSGDLRERQISDLYKFSVPMLTHYEDRMSMAHGCETRLPFLDYRVVDLLINAPVDFKLNNGWTKYVLRTTFSDVVPSQLIWRKDKQGFLNPEKTWLANELKQSVEDLFKSQMISYDAKIFDKEHLLRLYAEYCSVNKTSTKFTAKDIFYPIAIESWLNTFQDYIKV